MDIQLPTSEQTAYHMAIAEIIMGWPVVEKLFDPEGRSTPIVYCQEHYACLKGTPFKAQGLWDHSFKLWSPSRDPIASAELRERLVELGWEPNFCYENKEWTCVISKVTPAPVFRVFAPTFEESLVLGAMELVKWLRP